MCACVRACERARVRVQVCVCDMFMCVHICVWVYLPVCEHMCRRQRLVLDELLHCFSPLLLKIYLLLFMHMCVSLSLLSHV